MKVRCGRCGAEYSEIRKVCPKCKEDTKFAVYVEGENQGKTLYDVSRALETQKEFTRLGDWLSEEVKMAPRQIQVESKALPPIQEADRYKKKRHLFVWGTMIGLVLVVGWQLFENYRVDYREAHLQQPIPIQQVALKEVVDLGYNQFCLVDAQAVECDAIKKYLPEDMKLIAVAIEAIEWEYKKETKPLYASQFYGIYKEDEYIQPLGSSSLLSLLELEGYLPYYGPTYGEEDGEKTYLFFLVDQDVTALTVAYACENETAMRGEYVERIYQVQLSVD